MFLLCILSLRSPVLTCGKAVIPQSMLRLFTMLAIRAASRPEGKNRGHLSVRQLNGSRLFADLSCELFISFAYFLLSSFLFFISRHSVLHIKEIDPLSMMGCKYSFPFLLQILIPLFVICLFIPLIDLYFFQFVFQKNFLAYRKMYPSFNRFCLSSWSYKGLPHPSYSLLGEKNQCKQKWQGQFFKRRANS